MNVGDKVRSHYNKIPFNYDATAQVTVSKIKHCNLVKGYIDLFELLETGNIASLVDIGCGIGWLVNSVNFYYPNIKASGVDFCDKAIYRAREVATTMRLKSEFYLQDIIEFKIDKVDLVTSIGVLHHTSNPRQYFDHICGLTNKYIYLVLYHKYSRKVFLDAIDSYKKFTKFFDGADDVYTRSWYQDQICHPYESSHTLSEVSQWLTADMKIISTSINKDVGEALLTEDKTAHIARERLHKGEFYPGLFSVLISQ